MAILSTTPIVFARNDCGDLEIPLRKASGLEAVGILIQCAVNLWKDEYFLNRNAGVPWLSTPDGFVPESEAILGQVFDPAKVQRSLRPVISKVPCVGRITQIASAFDNEIRTLSVRVDVRAVFADIATDLSITTAIAV